jgi:competence ComEA-like helix-hairpin-helix protein
MAAAPQTGPATKPPNQPPSPLLAAWPRSAQWTTAFLLGVVVTLLGSQALSYLRWGSRPTELERVVVPAYRVDLNQANREELLQLPGVGDRMATRIEDFRKERGKIRRVDELTDVHGVGPATMDRLRDWVRVNEEDLEDDEGVEGPAPPHIRKNKSSSSAKAKTGKKANPVGALDVNSATAEQLMHLDGIGPITAQRIVEERQKKPFASIDDLQRVPRLKGKILEKIRPYITVNPPRDVASTVGK